MPVVLKLDNKVIAKVKTPEDHMKACMKAFGTAWREKYMKGQKEHGGKLWRKQCLPFLAKKSQKHQKPDETKNDATGTNMNRITEGKQPDKPPTQTSDDQERQNRQLPTD